MGFHTGEKLMDTEKGRLVDLIAFLDKAEGYLLSDDETGERYALTQKDVVSGRLRVPYYWEYPDYDPKKTEEDAYKQLDELVTQREIEVIMNMLTDDQVRILAEDWNQGREQDEESRG